MRDVNGVVDKSKENEGKKENVLVIETNGQQL